MKPRHLSPAQPAGRAVGGFTLIEMLIVVLIVGILASAAIPLAEMNRRREKESELRTALRILRTAIDAYKVACEKDEIQCAKTPLDGPASTYPPDLQALVEGVPAKVGAGGAGLGQVGENRRVYFLRRLPRDPFADPHWPAQQTWGLRSYDSPPDSPAPGKDVFDVYSMANGTGMDGVPYRQW